jgi:hypothetical protein
MELANHVLCMSKVLRQQPFAQFCQVSLVLHAIAQGTIPLVALEDLLKLILLRAIYFNRRRGFGCCTLVRYVWLQQQDLEHVVNVASLLRKLQAICLRAYLLYYRLGSLKPMAELLAWTLRSDVVA